MTLMELREKKAICHPIEGNILFLSQKTDTHRGWYQFDKHAEGRSASLGQKTKA